MYRPQTFILIHGAWHASWCWGRVAKELSLQGHKVLMPDLPGHGRNKQRSHGVGLADYVTSVLDLIQQQAEPVTLVGHSMAGLIISEIAERVPQAIRELVFIAAYVPYNQCSLFSLAQDLESNNVTPLLIIDETLQEIRLQDSPDLGSVFFNRCSRQDAQEAMSQLHAQPLRPFMEPVNIGEHFMRAAKRALVCRYDQALLLSDQLRMSRDVTENIIYLDADHAAYYSAVGQIVDALLK